MSEHPASIRDGRYAVLSVLGEGAQAQTLAAVDKLYGRTVAIKRFVVRGARSWKDVELAEREARVLGSLQHPNLPGYVEHFEEAGELYLVMDHVEGESLQQIKKRGALLPRAEVLRLLSEIGGVLGYLHAHSPPIIHRDIKPGNVIRRPDGSFVLVDFGSVRDRLKVEGGSTVVGTFGYMPPEQFQGRALAQTDVYALGATALSVLTGEEPENLPHRGLKLDVERALPNDPELAGLLSRLVEPNPDQRPPAVLPLLRELKVSSGRRQPAESERTRERSANEHHAPRDFDPLSTRPRGEPLPPIVLLVCMIGLGVARTTVRLALGLLVPMLLVILSVLFGNALRRAARHVRSAGQKADQALNRAVRVVRRLEIGPEPAAQWPPRRRVAQEPRSGRRGPRVVDVTGEDLGKRDEDPDVWESPSERRKKRR